jgi:hypothetical protein
LQAIGDQCGLIGGECEPAPQRIGAECELKIPLVCGFGCRCLQAATPSKEKQTSATFLCSHGLASHPPPPTFSLLAARQLVGFVLGESIMSSATIHLMVLVVPMK